MTPERWGSSMLLSCVFVGLAHVGSVPVWPLVVFACGIKYLTEDLAD